MPLFGHCKEFVQVLSIPKSQNLIFIKKRRGEKKIKNAILINQRKIYKPPPINLSGDKIGALKE